MSQQSLHSARFFIFRALADHIHREIIDESDVYIDNERTARRKFSNASAVVKPSDLKPHDPRESASDLSTSPRTNGNGQNSNDGDLTASPVFAPPRRHSTNLSLRQTLIASQNRNARARSRSPAPGAGEHLSRHLGPSNLASKPMVSKNSKIKIKPGKGIDGEVLAATERVREAAVDESSPLLGRDRE